MTLDLLHFSAAHEIYILKRQIKILPHCCEYTHMKNCQMCLHIVVFDIGSSIHLMQYVFLMVIWSACCSKAYSGLSCYMSTQHQIFNILFFTYSFTHSLTLLIRMSPRHSVTACAPLRSCICCIFAYFFTLKPRPITHLCDSNLQVACYFNTLIYYSCLFNGEVTHCLILSILI